MMMEKKTAMNLREMFEVPERNAATDTQIGQLLTYEMISAMSDDGVSMKVDLEAELFQQNVQIKAPLHRSH